MSGYEQIIRKDSRPYIESLRDDMRARRDKNFFWPTGTQVYCGKQGSGKTISAVKHLLELKERYPKAVVVSNIKLNYMEPRTFTDAASLSRTRVRFNPRKQYIFFDTMEQLAIVLTHVNNGMYGVIYIVDEIHTYFNALESKNVPMYVFTEISQQRKQRKLIIGTSQLFLRMAKPLREQCDNLIVCNTLGGILTIQRAYDGMSITQDYDGSLQGHQKRLGWFFHTRRIRNAFDTYQKVVSGQMQFEEVAKPLKVIKKGKQISLT